MVLGSSPAITFAVCCPEETEARRLWECERYRDMPMPISRAPTTPQLTPIPAFAPVDRPAFGEEESVDAMLPLEAVAFVELIVELVSLTGVQ